MNRNSITLDQKKIVIIREELQWRNSQSPESLCQLRCFSVKHFTVAVVFMYFTHLIKNSANLLYCGDLLEINWSELMAMVYRHNHWK